jgi:hypothetical protein
MPGHSPTPVHAIPRPVVTDLVDTPEGRRFTATLAGPEGLVVEVTRVAACCPGCA